MSDAFPRADIDRSIPHRFEMFARRYPDHIALRTPEEQTSYRALDDRANRIACAIVGSGGATRDVVAVMLDKYGSAPIAAFLGVLKSGRIYVALNPATTLEQHRLILADSGTSMLLTDGLHEALGQSVVPTGCDVVSIEGLEGDPARDKPRIDLAPDAPALLIYTSGSTGRPKGVLWNHRNFLYIGASARRQAAQPSRELQSSR